MGSKLVADPIHQDLGAASRYGAQSGFDKTLHYLGYGHIKCFGKKYQSPVAKNRVP